jgi:hypothetical protein
MGMGLTKKKVAKMGEWKMIGPGSGSCYKRRGVGGSIDASSQELETGRKLARCSEVCRKLFLSAC